MLTLDKLKIYISKRIENTQTWLNAHKDWKMPPRLAIARTAKIAAWWLHHGMLLADLDTRAVIDEHVVTIQGQLRAFLMRLEGLYNEHKKSEWCPNQDRGAGDCGICREYEIRIDTVKDILKLWEFRCCGNTNCQVAMSIEGDLANEPQYLRDEARRFRPELRAAKTTPETTTSDEYRECIRRKIKGVPDSEIMPDDK